MAQAVTLHSLPLFVRLAGRPVILLGEGEAADAKRRLLERAGARIVGEDAQAALAIVAIDDEEEAVAAVARLKARGMLVNAVDRSALCDFTIPAIVDRAPVLIAIGTGGVSAGLAAALRQRLEALLPAGLGALATALHGARGRLRERYPDAGARRRAIADALAEGGSLDPFRHAGLVPASIVPQALSLGGGWTPDQVRGDELERVILVSPDPDDLTLRQARVLASADRVYHRPDVPPAILDRARADAARIACDAAPREPGPGLSADLAMRA
ncbi:bifunctional precorrin-2 dehydrogenase/sirohydrochlorin ferrochelatase [Sphingomonas sp. PB2P19]|uniref:precorrin-2 dehydrogenase/sirohydrochlorin ferrochelatase family protein n=1 Tax=Sphingomonas rhamnosi TaxID=3096156 RepID=UPI002FCB55A1